MTCVCGHPPWWHKYNRFAGLDYCTLCAVCGKEDFYHKQDISHRFTTCNCKGDN